MAAPSIGSNGRGLAQEAAPRIDAAERATSSVLALDGWGRIEPEPARSNGVAPPPPPQPALWDELTARFAALEAPQISIAPAWRLFGPAALMGLAFGALVGGAMRWWQLYSAPPPAPPPPAPRDPLTELRARVASFQASDERDIRERLRVLVAPPPASPPPPQQRFPQRWQELLAELADRTR